jgi:hypothetical protein
VRVSVLKGHDGYELWEEQQLKFGKVFDVFLDGIEQKAVQEADEEAGYIIRAILDDDGEEQLNPDNPNELWVETVRGRVEVRIRDGD